MRELYDVIVTGAGAAGIVAAIQAARAGASVLLVEKNGLAGGTMTAGGVNYPGLFHAWGRQVIAGIGWELVSRAVAEGGGTLPDFSQPPPRHSAHQVRVNLALFAALADEALVQAGAEILFHTMVARAQPRPTGWELSLCTKTGLRPVRARVLVDCTGDANLVQLAGLPVRRDEPLQPGTLIFRLGGYDFDSLNLPAIEGHVRAAIEQGTLKSTDFGWGTDPVRKFLRGRGTNAVHICGIDGTTSEGRTAAELAGREAMLRLYRFFRRQEGLERLTIESVAAECGIRQTVSMVGRETIAGGDYLSGRRWDDALCYSFYPVDIHTADHGGLDLRSLEPGVVPTIPRGAMLPRDGRFLIAAGRHISADRLAYAACRVQATCMATGQAAGAMAALSAREGVDSAELDLADIRALLARHGAIIP